MKNERIDLDPNELLGLSQVAKIAGEKGDRWVDARLLSKIGEGPLPSDRPARLLRKIGESPITNPDDL